MKILFLMAGFFLMTSPGAWAKYFVTMKNDGSCDVVDMDNTKNHMYGHQNAISTGCVVSIMGKDVTYSRSASTPPPVIPISNPASSGTGMVINHSAAKYTVSVSGSTCRVTFGDGTHSDGTWVSSTHSCMVKATGQCGTGKFYDI